MHLAIQLMNLPKENTWVTVPDQMSPWLWRISFGLYNHNDAVDKMMNELGEYLGVHGTLFPSNCQYFIKHKSLSNNCAL